jgi:hypothetical protein
MGYMRYTAGILCIWLILGACSIQRNNETMQDHLPVDEIRHFSPLITTIENLHDSLQPT